MNIHVCCENLHFSYGDTIVLNNASFILQNPGFYSFIGKSGVGKTTLARIIKGDLDIDKGSVSPKSANIIYSYSGEKLNRWQNVRDHLLEVISVEEKTSLISMIKKFHLEPSILERKRGGLSTGQIDRLNVLRYLYQDWDILIMDESLANVDEISRYNIISEIKKYVPDDRFIIYITHHIVEACAYSNKLMVIREADSDRQIKSFAGLDLEIFSPGNFKDIHGVAQKVIQAA